jgi:hypothetical protein
MKRYNRSLPSFIGAIALAALTSSAGAADIATKAPPQLVTSPAPVSNWTFQITAYLWAAGLEGDVRLGPNAPMTHVDASFGDILSDLRFAAMATVEVRYARLGVVADLMYLSLATSVTGPRGFLNAQLKDKTLIATVSGAYRVVDAGSWWLDLEAGARIWAMDMDLVFSVVPLGVSRNYSLSKSWADPIIGIRARAYLNEKFFVQGYADVGGFDVASKSTWQLAGIIGYQHSPAVSFFAGYRYLAVDYNRNGFIWDVDMHGPMFGASFRLN